MRYPPERKAKTRDAVLKAAACELRECGFFGVGVDRLSAAAGVTSGAFYSHFSSKEDVLASVIDANLGRPFIEPGDGDLTPRRERLRAYLRSYISLEHRDAPGQGCVIPALSADVARLGLAVRTIYQERMGPVSFVHFSPDGRRVVAASDKTIRIFDARTGEVLERLFGHDGDVTALFSTKTGQRSYRPRGTG